MTTTDVPRDQLTPLARGRGDGVGRLARRTQRDQGRRRVLVLALIAAAVALGVATGGLAASAARSDEVIGRVDRFGSADLLLAGFGEPQMQEAERLTSEQQAYVEEHALPLTDDGQEGRGPGDRGGGPAVSLAQLLPALPPGSEVLRFTSSGLTKLVNADDDLLVTDMDVTAPLAGGTFDAGDRTSPLVGDEALVSPSHLDELGIAVGDTTDVEGIGRIEVVGTVTRAVERSSPVLVVAPGRELGPHAFEEAARAQLPRGTGDEAAADAVRELGAELAELSGAGEDELFSTVPEVESRSGWLASRTGSATVATLFGGIAGGLAATLAALVAACAFAVGVRRRLRQIGMLGAVGADPDQLARLLRREGLLLGSGGALLGGVVGVVLSVAGVPVLERLMDQDVAPVLPVAAIVLPVLLGAVAALAAAFWPARTAAGIPVVAALAERVPSGRVPGWLPAASLALSAGGLGLIAVTLRSEDEGALGVLVVFVAILMATLGAAGLGLPVVALGGRIADRLPLLGRLALRDSARQRSRSGAAIAALVAVVALPVAVVGFTTADLLAEPDAPAAYQSQEPSPFVVVDGPYVDGLTVPPSPAQLTDVAWVLPDVDGRADVVTLGLPDPGTDGGDLLLTWDPPTDQASPPAGPDFVDGVAPVLATRELLDLLGVERPVPDGEVLLLPDSGHLAPPADGAQVRLLAPSNTTSSPGLPTLRADVRSGRAGLPFAPGLVSPATAERLGLIEVGRSVALALPAPPTYAQAEQLWNADVGAAMRVEPEPPTLSDELVPRLIVAGIVVAAVVVATVVAGMTAALAATESDGDLRKVVAFGAPPRTRRLFHGVQAWWHTLIATVLGTGLGLALAAVVLDDAAVLTDAPWGHLGAVIALLPVVVGLVIAAFLRSSPVTAPRRRLA